MRHQGRGIRGKIPLLAIVAVALAACGGSAIVVADPEQAIGGAGSTWVPAPTTTTTTTTATANPTPPPTALDETPGARFLFAEAFDDGSDEFPTGSDGHTVSEVATGALRFELIDVSTPQAVRHELSKPQPHVRFEATVTLASHHVGELSIGCWSGQRSYLALLTGDRFFGIIERGVDGDARYLHQMTRSRYVAGATEPNRVRVDCMTNNAAAWFSLFVNGMPLASVVLPGNITEFDAVGFTGNSDWPGASYLIDDVMAVHCLEAPAVPAADLDAFIKIGGVAWFERDGLGFAYPRDWIYDRGLPDMPGEWAFVVAPDDGDNHIALALATNVRPDQLDTSPAELADAVFKLMLPGGASIAVEPDQVIIGGVSGFAASFQVHPERGHGQALAGRAALMFSDFGALMLYVQHSAELEESMLQAWQGVLDSFHP